MGKTAFIFPGQGSQQVGMGQAIANTYKKARDIFAEAEEVLKFQFTSLCFDGPGDQLQLTMNAQPAILTTSIACLRVFEDAQIIPDYVAGHSLGEYSALVAAGAIPFSDAVATVRKRGLYMEEAVPAGIGSMAAILNLDRDILVEICQEVSSQEHIVEPANFNCPGQIVISGHRAAVEEASNKALEKGARKAIPLPVSGPFHSSLMQPAANRLKEALETISIYNAQIPVIANVSATPVIQRDEILDSLVKQVFSPVLWEDSVRYLIEHGVDTFVEIGNQDVLSRLIKKTERTVNTFSVQDPASLADTLNKLGGISTC